MCVYAWYNVIFVQVDDPAYRHGQVMGAHKPNHMCTDPRGMIFTPVHTRVPTVYTALCGSIDMRRMV